jgi:regulator of sirC expression with transglutaminase-like and TPR domain
MDSQIIGFSLKELKSQPTTTMVSWLPNLEQIFASHRILEPAEAAQLVNAKTQKLLTFWGYELIEKTKLCPNLNERLIVLSDFFFTQLGFKPAEDSPFAADDRSSILFTNVITKRSGPALLVGLIYCYLAEQIGIKAGWVALDKPMIIKVMLNGETRFVDLDKKCVSLQGQQVVDLASQNSSAGLQFSLVDAKEFCEHYLKQVLTRLILTQQTRRCITLLNFLTSLEPTNLFFLKRRAFLLFEVGEFEKAMEDLKTYRFHSAHENLPIDLAQLSLRLNAVLERQVVTSLH